MAVDDELLNRVTWKIPNVLALVGSAAGGERNGMTTSWITQLSMEPVLIGIGVDNSAVTHRLITDGRSFTVNLWDASDTKVFVKFSKPAEYADGALNGRPVRDKLILLKEAADLCQSNLTQALAQRPRLDPGEVDLTAGELPQGRDQGTGVIGAQLREDQSGFPAVALAHRSARRGHPDKTGDVVGGVRNRLPQDYATVELGGGTGPERHPRLIGIADLANGLRGAFRGTLPNSGQ